MGDFFEELIIYQKDRVFVCARSIIPYLTKDDVLQPNDFPELEQNPYFRFEEGVLQGILTAQMAYLAKLKES